MMRHHGRLVLVPCPYQGHISPMLQLGTCLQSLGFSVTVVQTNYNSPKHLNQPNLTFLSIPDGLSDDEISSGYHTSLVLAINVNCLAPLEECLVGIMKNQQPHEELVGVIYDELMYFAEVVANRLGLPSIIFRTNNAATFRCRDFLLQLMIGGYLPFSDSTLQEPVPGHYPLKFKDLPISNFGISENILQALNNMRNIRTSSAVIWNTTDSLEESPLAQIKQECPVPIFSVGPIHKFDTGASSSSLLEEDTSCITWLDKQARKSVIYISLGSLASMNVSDFSEMAWGLANSRQLFLWVVRPGSVIGSEWVESLTNDYKEAVRSRGCIVQWAPQKQVLRHEAVGLFWTHCGWNSTLESICEGVPMICSPFFGDQKVTARYVSEVWRVGTHMENKWERGEIEKTIRMLMADDEGEETRQRAIDLKNKVEACTREGGSSYNSVKKLVDFIMSLKLHD